MSQEAVQECTAYPYGKFLQSLPSGEKGGKREIHVIFLTAESSLRGAFRNHSEVIIPDACCDVL
jgi:hypothetical protein